MKACFGFMLLTGTTSLSIVSSFNLQIQSTPSASSHFIKNPASTNCYSFPHFEDQHYKKYAGFSFQISASSKVENEAIKPETEILIEKENSSIISMNGEKTLNILDETQDGFQLPPFSKILTLCFFIAALSALDRVAMSIAVLPLSSEFHLTETIKGQIASAFSAGYGLAVIPCGLFVASVSPRIVMTFGITLWSIATILTPWATTFISSSYSPEIISGNPSTDAIIFTGVLPLLIIRGLVGAAESFVLPTIQRFIINWVPSESRSLAIATIFAGFQTGTIAAYLVSPNVIDALGGWRELFYLYGVIGLIYLVPWLILAKDSPVVEQYVVDVNAEKMNSLDMFDEDENMQDLECKVTNTGIEDDASLLVDCEPSSFSNFNEDKSVPTSQTSVTVAIEDALEVIKSAPWKQLLTTPGVLAMTAAHAANNWGLYNNLAWIPTFYSEQYGLNVRDSAFLALIPSIAGALGGLSAGTIADYFIKKQWFGIEKDGRFDTTNIRKVFQGVALFGPSLCLAVLASHIPDSPSTARLILTGAVGLQAFNAAGYGASATEKAGEKWSGLLYSITSLPGVIFGTFGVYLTGQILDATDSNWSLVFACNVVVNVIGAMAFVLYYDSKKEFD